MARLGLSCTPPPSLFSSHGAGLTPEGSGAAHCLRTGTAVSADGTAFYALILLLEDQAWLLHLDQSLGETCFRGLEAGDTIGS